MTILPQLVMRAESAFRLIMNVRINKLMKVARAADKALRVSTVVKEGPLAFLIRVSPSRVVLLIFVG